jgi:hypothetical protein
VNSSEKTEDAGGDPERAELEARLEKMARDLRAQAEALAALVWPVPPSQMN